MVLDRETIAFWYHAHQEVKQKFLPIRQERARELMTTRKQRERKREEKKQSKARGPYKVAKPLKGQPPPKPPEDQEEQS